MKHKSCVFSYCLIAALAGAVPYSASAVVRVRNTSGPNKAGYYNQINAMQAQTAYADSFYDGVVENAPSADAETGLPVRVANQNIAKAITTGGTYNGIGRVDLESCARIYPDGEFAWDTPNAGNRQGGSSTCVAVVELRSIDPVPGGTERNVLLARANLAAGDAFKCNIEDFPESSYTAAAGQIIFPADAEPTRQDVIRVLNDEQKQHAGLKIAALTVVGALGGNIAGKNEVGEDSLMGTGRHKMQGTAIGALGGAAIGVGSVYGGKVGGDMILSGGVNATAGAIVGNMVASGDEVLRIEDCTLENGEKTTCLWGRLVMGENLNPEKESAFYNFIDQTTVVCDAADENGAYKNCRETQLISVVLDAYPNQTIDRIDSERYEKITGDPSKQFHMEKSTTPGIADMILPGGGDVIWAQISSAGRPTDQVPAMVVGVKNTAFGKKRSDWAKERQSYSDDALRGRRPTGEAYPLSDKKYTINDFYPMYVSASDGGLIDFSNKARLKGTLIGAGAGGAMGAFVGYQGAQNEIENRWVTAVREYKDSLQKVYCITGGTSGRFLSYYNDIVTIPAMQ